jgi:hypothetical protein
MFLRLPVLSPLFLLDVGDGGAGSRIIISFLIEII